MQKAPASRVEARTFWQRWLSSDPPTKACSADDCPRTASDPCAGARPGFPQPARGGRVSSALGAISEARSQRRIGRYTTTTSEAHSVGKEKTRNGTTRGGG